MCGGDTFARARFDAGARLDLCRVQRVDDALGVVRHERRERADAVEGLGAPELGVEESRHEELEHAARLLVHRLRLLLRQEDRLLQNLRNRA
jgi:hypothetical protein